MTALYQTYRPRKLDEVVGQDHVKAVLRNAVKNGRLAHAYLFNGTRGCGKTTLARILAMMVNCEDGPSVDYDLNSRIVKSIINGTCQDVIELDAASKSKVEEIREMIASSHMYPIQGRKKVFIIDEVHCLSGKAASALLKTLEEPSKHTMFILCTTEIQKIIPTIRSRCQQFDLRKLTIEQIATHLEKVAKDEGVKKIDGASLQMVAKAGRGSMRDALSTFDAVLARCDEHITEEAVADIIGVTKHTFFVQLMEHMLAGNHKKAIVTVKSATASGMSPEHILMSMLEFSHEMLMAKAINYTDHLYIEPSIKDKWIEIMKKTPKSVLIYYVKKLQERAKDVSYLPREDIVLDTCVIELTEGTSKAMSAGK